MSSKISLTRLVLAALALAALPLAAQAATPVNVSQGMTLAGAPLAIHGYDAVAYFTEGKALVGQAAYAVVHDGAAYRFVSESNRKAFEKEPDRYAPQFGGFCAYGVALGAKFDGDPRLFTVDGGKLYFNLSPDIQQKWEEDRAGNIRKAEETWPTIRDKDPAKLGK